MKYESFSIPADDGINVFVSKWMPEVETKVNAVVQIAHGNAEHSGRYEHFAQALVEEGFVVYANDHRGSGKTLRPGDTKGYLADENGWNKTVDDMHKLTDVIKRDYPGIPVFLFGHSMGSVLCRSYISLFGGDIKGLILTGTCGNPGILGKIVLSIAQLEALLKGRRALSAILYKFTTDSYNSSFKPNRTQFDWLSRDNAEVDKYVADPLCGFDFSLGWFIDFLKGLQDIYKDENLKKIPKDLPIILLSGDKDPFGDMGKGLLDTYNTYKRIGMEDVTYKLYKDARHELLNEINREEVYPEIVSWIKKIYELSHRV